MQVRPRHRDGTAPVRSINRVACYAMQFPRYCVLRGGSPPSLQVTADVILDPDPVGGFRISGIKLTVRGSAVGIDPQAFAKIAVEAKDSCPVGKGSQGSEITLDVDAASGPANR